MSSGGSIHHVDRDALSYVWDDSRAPALEVDSGETLSLHARDASNGQIDTDSTADAVLAIDLEHVNPVSGPVFVKGAKPGDVLAVELLELKPSDWGWTALSPGFGLLADEFPDPWLRISDVDAAASLVRFSDRVSVPLRAFPGTIGVAPAEPGEFPILRPSRWGGNLDIRHLEAGTTLFLPVASRARCYQSETHTPRRATVRCAGPRSKVRWESFCVSPFGESCRLSSRLRPPAFRTGAPAWIPCFAPVFTPICSEPAVMPCGR